MQKVWGREVAKGAWEELGEWEILVPSWLGKRGDEGVETRMWRVDVSLEEVGASLESVGKGVGDVLGKWCKEV